jgi:tetratricopeptide (TPR) repeat protein
MNIRAGLLLCGLLATPAALAVAAQSSSSETVVQQRLNRLATDIFAPTPNIQNDIRELKEVLAEDPNRAEAHLLLGVAYRRLGTPDVTSEAIAELRQAVSLNPRLLAARMHLAYLYLDIGRPQRAREEIDAALEHAPGNPQLLALGGEAERQLKNPQRAMELAQQALKGDPSSAEARYYLGLALFDLGKRADAIKELEQVVASGQAVADAYLSLGMLYIEAGSLDAAVKTLMHGVQLDTTRVDLRVQLARAYRSKGLLDKAEEQLRLARPKPGAPLAASEYRQQQIQFDLALEQGALDVQRGRITAAVAAFKKVLTMDPAHGPANRYLAQIYLRQGAYAAAAQYAQRAEKAGAPLSAEERAQLQAGLRKK